MFCHLLVCSISSYGCASIVCKHSSEAPRASESLRLTADDLFRLKIIDAIVPEPEGGAHSSFDETARLLDGMLSKALSEALTWNSRERLARRYQKFRYL